MARAERAAGRYARWASEAREDDAEQADECELVAVAAREVVRFAAGGASDGVPEAVRVGASRGDPGGDGVLAADLVRRWLPLSEVLLARAGEAVPDELVPDGLGG